MIGKLEKKHVIIETTPAFSNGAKLDAAVEIAQAGEGESEWIDFDSDFTFSGEEDTESLNGFTVKKSRDLMLAETVALAQRLSAQKKSKIFQPEEDFSDAEEEYDKADLPTYDKRTAESLSSTIKTEKNSEAMACGAFFASIALSLASLLLSFAMLGMPHFPGILGFVFFELVATLLLFAAWKFLNGWGYPERSFRMGLMCGFLSWEVLIFLFWSMLITALWKDHTLFLLEDKENSAILISFLAGIGVFVMSLYFLRGMEWARATVFVVGKSGLIFVSLAVAGIVAALADLLLFL
ncbi:hypothetical protein FAI41_01605 [Acetobacteraceae bacterium]|nr:hypothetical protein FAI41_01605 [Acetobacteraceae bacterium]